MRWPVSSARKAGIKVPQRKRGGPWPVSPLEDLLAQQLLAARIGPFERELRFSDARGFRADFAFPDERLIVEVQGGTLWGKSRHSYGAGFDNDCEKAAEAARLGWRWLPVSSRQVRSGRALELVRRVLAGQPIWKEAT